MYVTPAIIVAAEGRYGAPLELGDSYKITAGEMAMIRASQRDGRAHDVTVCVFNGDRLAVIAKPSYPPGAYRVPGGALRRGEAMDAGGAREAYEETGLRATIQRYLLRVQAHFYIPDDGIDWTTHVLVATTPDDVIDPQDRHEIREARWSTLAELNGPIRDVLLASGHPLFAYRAALHQRVAACLAP